MLLYLTSNQKSNLIDPAVRNMTLPAKKLVGRFSLKSFVTKDMRNYANAKFFVVDAACIEESGNDFTLALQSFQMMFSARIIVILSGCEDVNGEVQRLLSIDVVNLVTGETMEDALDELTEALSEDGMQRYVVKAPVYEQPVTQREKAPEPDEIIPYRWNARNIRIAVAGSQRRSGVTVTAFNLASWLAARGAEVAYIEVNQNRHLQLLLNIYEAAPDGEHYTIDGIDCYLTNEPDKEYQFIIYDCGVMQTPTSIFRDADHRLLCGSVLPYEIPVFHKALSECGSDLCTAGNSGILYGTLWGRCSDCGGIPRPVCETSQRTDLPAAGGEVYCRRKAPVTVRHDWEDWNMAKFEYMQRAFSSELKPRARLVLQVLVLHCNKEGECFPSIKTIAAKCGYGVSTVKRALDELVKAGYIVKQARFDERKNGGQTSNLYTLCSDLPCPGEPENAPVPEDDASDESPVVQPENVPVDACNAPDPTPGEQSATLPTVDSYSFADGFETKIGRQNCRPIRMWTGGQSIFIPP